MKTTIDEAIDMMRQGGVDLAAELSNVMASYCDICEEIERAGEEPSFDLVQYEAALRDATNHPCDQCGSPNATRVEDLTGYAPPGWEQWTCDACNERNYERMCIDSEPLFDPERMDKLRRMK